jgi:succinate dehydrogenase/fumarate reductase flavoprotein subunit
MEAVELLDRQLDSTVPKTVPERKLKEDLKSASFILKAILTASLARAESRGSFNRKDFPREDNVNWQKNSCLIYDRKKKELSLSHHPVVAPIGK